MKNKTFLILILLLFTLQLSSYAEENKQNIGEEQLESGWSAGDIDLSKTDPIGLMDILKENKDDWITVGQAPEGWIKKEHVDQLIKLIDSKDIAAPVVSRISSYLPMGEKSTVGNEAMFLIQGFKEGRYPPGICSVYGFKGNPEEYKKWYNNQRNGS
jgi:hypothetical protein